MQPFDLTDFDWSSELWIASHDDDEQNARLAEHVWEDNGLDVPESYLEHLLPFLGAYAIFGLVLTLIVRVDHANAYVRASAAASIAEAVEQWPQTVRTTLSVLQEFYREKVGEYYFPSLTLSNS